MVKKTLLDSKDIELKPKSSNIYRIRKLIENFHSHIHNTKQIAIYVNYKQCLQSLELRNDTLNTTTQNTTKEMDISKWQNVHKNKTVSVNLLIFSNINHLFIFIIIIF